VKLPRPEECPDLVRVRVHVQLLSCLLNGQESAGLSQFVGHPAMLCAALLAGFRLFTLPTPADPDDLGNPGQGQGKRHDGG
jgi:hypothetical protein